MSDLRKHLETARQEHQSLRYPGNLADEVLKRSHRSRAGVLIRIGAVAAMAAAVMIVVRFRMNATSSVPNQIAIVNPQTDEDVASEADEESQTEVASFG